MSFSNIDAYGASTKIRDSNCEFISKLAEAFELLELVYEKQGNQPDFVFLEVNPAYEKLTGFKAAEIIGKHKKEVAPASEQRWYDYAFQALKTGETLQYDYLNPTLNRYFETQFIPVSTNKIAVLFKDTTERKKNEAAVKQSEDRLKIYLESTPSAVFVADPNGKYLFVNESACRLLDFSKEEFLSMNISQVLCEDSLAQGLLQFNLVKETGRSHGELCLKKRNGSPVYVILTATKLPDDNLIANCEDVTERRELEKQLKEKERLAVIGQTAGMVGHDIRNPLQSIVSSAYLIKMDLDNLPESEEKNNALVELNSIFEQVNYTDKVVSDLQDYAKRLEPELEAADIKTLVTDALSTLNVPDNIEARAHFNKKLKKLKTDKIIMKRVLFNLATNAIQAMPQGGILTINVNVDETSSKLIITVEDTGVGIPNEVRDKLFTPLFTTKAKGQGLGLAVVKRLVEALNGKVSFESEEGKGTTFKIELPAMS